MVFRKTAILSLLLLSTISARSALAQKDLKVAVARVNETRQVDHIKDPDLKYNQGPGYLSVIIRLSGDDIKNATRFGAIKWTSVKDDTGKSLIRSQFSNSRLSVLRRDNLLAYGKPRDNMHDFSSGFSIPARSAKTISELKGECKLRLGKTEAVSFPLDKVKTAIGNRLVDDKLKKHGIDVQIESFSSSSGVSIRAKITGKNKDTFLKLQLVDNAGKPLTGNSYAYTYQQYLSANTSSFDKIPDGAQLQVVVETEFKDVPVSIDLKDIELP